MSLKLQVGDRIKFREFRQPSHGASSFYLLPEQTGTIVNVQPGYIQVRLKDGTLKKIQPRHHIEKI